MLLLILAGLAGGLVDSVIGGGGLIGLPAIMLSLGITPTAVGTNKVAGALCTLAALSVYGWKGHVRWRIALPFAAWTAAGSILGSALSPRFLVPFYRTLLWAGTGACLLTLFFRERLAEAAKDSPHKHEGGPTPLACGLGFLCGLYDGAWGPGGGTFMFLALYYATPVGLVGAMGSAKIVNFASSSFATLSYALQGKVDWPLGAAFGACFAVGALGGASLASKHPEKVLKPVLLAVTGLLLYKLLRG